MEQYLLDTNVVSHYFSNSFTNDGIHKLNTIFDSVPIISIISKIELLSWVTDKGTEKKVKEFIDDSTILDMTPDVVTHCIKLRRGKKIKNPDAIIAATALNYGFTLITNNEKDFENIPKLKLINPHKL